MAQYAVLVSLDEERGLSNAELARRAFVTPQTMNQVLRELEAGQLVLRRPHRDHGRVLQAHRAPEGIEFSVGVAERSMTSNSGRWPR